MMYFGLIWWPVGKLLQLIFLIYFSLYYLGRFLSYKVRKGKKVLDIWVRNCYN